MKRKVKRILKTLALTALMSVTAGFPLANAEGQPNENYILGTFFESNENISLQCYVADDNQGIYFSRLLAADDIKGRDPSCQYYDGDGYFYVCLTEPKDKEGSKYSENTFKIYRTKDFKEWWVLSFKVTDRSSDTDRIKGYREIWAPDLFIDDKGEGYVYFARQRDNNPKPYEDLFDTYVCKIGNITQLADKFVKVLHVENENEENGLHKPTLTGRIDKVEGEAVNTIKYEDDEKIKAVPITFDKEYNNLIDAQVRRINGKYYMVIKNEEYLTSNYNKSPLLFVSDKPDGEFKEVPDWPLRGLRGYEGFSILERNGNVYFYADNFSRSRVKYDDVGDSGQTVWFTDVKNIESGEKGTYKFSYVETLDKKSLRHGSVINNLDNKAIVALGIDEKNKSEGNENQQLEKSNSETGDKPKITLTWEAFGKRENKGDKKNTDIDNFAPAPDVEYVIPAKKTVNIDSFVNSYGVSEFVIMLQKKSTFKFKGSVVEQLVEGKKFKVPLIWDGINGEFKIKEDGIESIE